MSGSNDKLNILIYPSMAVPNACDLYRHVNPFKYSDKINYRVEYEIPTFENREYEGGPVISKSVDPTHTVWADIVLFVRYYYKDNLPLLKNLVELAKYYKKKIVYETDDLLHKVRDNTCSEKEFKKNQKIKHLSTMEYIMDNADVMTVSTQPLKDFYQNKVDCPIHVLPNYYDPEQWDNVVIKKKKKRKFRIGWAGGRNHYQRNFSLLAEPFNYLHKKYKDEIEFVVMCHHHPNQDWFEGHINPFKFEFDFHLPVSIDEYPQALADMDLDLGIVVVQDNEFSNAKSNIKWMEYGLVGVPCIASDVGPYKNTTALLVDNSPEQWIKSIELMMTNQQKYGIIKKQTEEKVREFDIKKHYHKWEKVYQDVKMG